ncbi:hypothetical protein BDK51DRAFT_29636, partial [Blyttiomyces helicus]
MAAAAHPEPPKVTSLEDECAHWKARVLELELAAEESRAMFDEFQQESQDYEKELSSEMTRLETLVTTTTSKLELARREAQQWRDKLNLQRLHSQAEMDRVMDLLRVAREEGEVVKRAKVDLELDNDEKERTERVALASMEDLEARHSALLEQNAILRSELESRAGMGDEIAHLQE